MSLYNLLTPNLPFPSHPNLNPNLFTPIKSLLTQPFDSNSILSKPNRYKKRGLSLTNVNLNLSLTPVSSLLPSASSSFPWCGNTFQNQHQLIHTPQLSNFLAVLPPTELESRIVRNPQSILKNIDLQKVMISDGFLGSRIDEKLARSEYQEMTRQGMRRTIVDRRGMTGEKRGFESKEWQKGMSKGIDYENRILIRSGEINRGVGRVGKMEEVGGSRESFRRREDVKKWKIYQNTKEDMEKNGSEVRERANSMKKTQLSHTNNRHRKTELSGIWK